jgi:hypothetical protein
VLKDAFVHSLSASLRLSTAVAVAGVVIALVMLRESRAPAHAPVPPSVVPVAHRPD